MDISASPLDVLIPFVIFHAYFSRFLKTDYVYLHFAPFHKYL